MLLKGVIIVRFVPLTLNITEVLLLSRFAIVFKSIENAANLNTGDV